MLVAEVDGLARSASELRGRKRAVGLSDSSVHRYRARLGLVDCDHLLRALLEGVEAGCGGAGDEGDGGARIPWRLPV